MHFFRERNSIQKIGLVSNHFSFHEKKKFRFFFMEPMTECEFLPYKMVTLPQFSNFAEMKTRFYRQNRRWLDSWLDNRLFLSWIFCSIIPNRQWKLAENEMTWHLSVNYEILIRNDKFGKDSAWPLRQWIRIWTIIRLRIGFLSWIFYRRPLILPGTKSKSLQVDIDLF